MDLLGSPALSATALVLLLLLFYGGTMVMSMRIARKDENADNYMTAGHRIGFGISAASMTATWIWASSMYASVNSGYLYGVSGPIHYGLWGALMILFIYPFGRRIRKVAPQAHTLAEVMFARHGRSSQLMLAGSNILGSVISLTSNFIAGGALIAMLSPFSFMQGIIVIAAGVLLYTLWSGFRASVLTDFAQVLAMLGAVIIIVPSMFFFLGGVEVFSSGAANLTPQQSNFFSSDAFLNQGAPYIAAVLAYAIGNQTIAQRLFAVREDLIKPTFITATIGYGATIIGIGMVGVLALYAGIDPVDGDPNNILPQVAAEYLPGVLVAVFFIMIIGSLSSTADSDLSAMSSIAMTDVYGQSLRSKGKVPNPRTMLIVGRLTMVLATAAALVFANIRFNILDLLVFVGALWGALVFPVIASFYWKKVTNMAFTVSVLAALAVFLPTRFGAIPDSGVLAYGIEALAVVGVGVVLGLMVFGFFGLRPALVVGAIAALGSAPFIFGFLRDYDTLTASLVAYAVSTIVCAAMSFRSSMDFDFAKIAARTADYDTAESAEALEAQSDDDGRDQNVRTDDDDDDLVRV
ncbi:sodium:solute symporter family protein [Dietzia kunjamensis]|jgi:Na+/proline symporter|uniref:Sodium:proline symporter n=1 Tax=Dietzia maris TaxID=37915 RepID=A0A365PBZ0_9ACTN|nr:MULTISPECIES: sodium:solute symporter family protein [Dietzia]MBB0993391.1 sodium:solute symporter family protein [Dietzia sp. SLG510A3-40A3]MBB1008631.1 sodium:solute symporter family protein [Dietzia sp. SLG510A3-3B2-2]RBA38318.1 sodium:proline symporter [Dietzia maris]MBB1017260.1 sodium:solute symporter family protein [Dietzia sp. DQ11-71]MCZ4656007.1 sodium:solute symporter family protein [Dietzia kunjamensis]